MTTFCSVLRLASHSQAHLLFSGPVEHMGTVGICPHLLFAVLSLPHSNENGRVHTRQIGLYQLTDYGCIILLQPKMTPQIDFSKKWLINAKSWTRDSEWQKSLLKLNLKVPQIPHNLLSPSAQIFGIHWALGSCGFQWCGFHLCTFSINYPNIQLMQFSLRKWRNSFMFFD